MGFDTYFDGAAFSAVSNFQIGKNSNQLRVLYNQSATAQGSVVPMLVAHIGIHQVTLFVINRPTLSLSANRV